MPDKSLEKTVEKDIKIAEKKFHKTNIWMITSIILIVVLVGVLMYFVNMAPSSSALGNGQEVADNALKFINANLVQPGTNASFVSTEEFQGMYNVTVSYQGRNISVFMTKDGNNMFLSSPLNISEELPTANNTETETPTEIPKTDKTNVQLFVMAFCPYGIQAETAMKPVVDLLGNAANISVHFIATVSGTTPDSVQSLHGAVEAQEDLRQVCVMKYYDQKTFWKYVTTINSNCSSKYRDATYDECWKDAATKAGINVSKIDACSTGSEGVNLLKADAALTDENGVSGSPTLLINGVTYNGARTADAYKQAICSGFNTAPSQCSQQLNSTAAAASGNC